MSAWLIVFVGVIYGWIAVDNFFKGNLAMFVVFAGYAFSNIGLYLLADK